MRNRQLSIAIWNTQWKASQSLAGLAMKEMLLSHEPDVVCITEGNLDQLPADWHVCSSEADHGYHRVVEGQRKVLLFSRNPWRDIDSVGSQELPPGRFVSATTDTAIGPMRFVGVCVPWRDAHVSTGMRNRAPWQEHKCYLKALRPILDNLPEDSLVLGDFNQRQPRHWQPIEVEQLLLETLGREFKIVTSGKIPDVGELSIDHLACKKSFELESITGLYKKQGDIEFSDHFGLAIQVRRSTALAELGDA